MNNRTDFIDNLIGNIEDEYDARCLEQYITGLEQAYERLTPMGAILTMLTRAGWARLRTLTESGQTQVYGRWPKPSDSYGRTTTSYEEEELIFTSPVQTVGSKLYESPMWEGR